MASSTTHETFRQIAVRAADAEQAGRLAAEAYAAGAIGLEERERENRYPGGKSHQAQQDR